VKEGTLRLLVDGQTKALSVGHAWTVPQGVPHKPFSATDQTIIGEMGGSGFPEGFPVSLSQLSCCLDEDERNTRPWLSFVLPEVQELRQKYRN
jgi:hypothetical protein